MDAYDWSTGVYATAVAMAKCMTTEELSRTAILLTQLGTTLGTLAALRQMEEGGTGAVTEVYFSTSPRSSVTVPSSRTKAGMPMPPFFLTAS